MLEKGVRKFPYLVERWKFFTKLARVWLIRFPEERHLKDLVDGTWVYSSSVGRLLSDCLKFCGILKKVPGEQGEISRIAKNYLASIKG